jgi:peptide/histidine transporter 3/4
VTDFMGTSFLLCLLGGFLADSFLGRFKTIGIFSAIQTLVSYITISSKLYSYSAEITLYSLSPT